MKLKSMTERISILVFFIMVGLGLLSVIVQIALNFVSKESIGIAGVVFLIVIFINGVVLFLSGKINNCFVLKDLISRLESIILFLNDNDANLLTVDDIVDLEQQCKSEVWVATLSLDIDMIRLKEIIINNIKKGITYKYMVYGSDENKAICDQMMAQVKNKDRINIQYVDFFPFTTETIIFDPNHESPFGYIVLPVSSKSKRRYIAIQDKKEFSRIRGLMYGVFSK